MAEYFGEDRAQALQREGDGLATWFATTPGACPTGRAPATDDPDKLGWDVIDEMFARNGAAAFRLFPKARLAELEDRFGPRGCRTDTWDTLIGTTVEITQATGPLLATGLPPGLQRADVPPDPEAGIVTRMQAFMQDNGLMPFSGRMLTGGFGPVTNVVLTGEDGGIVAMSHSYFPHNAFSPYRTWAWGGLAVVTPPRRGNGLGRLVNAMMAREAVSEMGATHLYELVGSYNLPSRRMVEAAGLIMSEDFVTAVVQPEGAGRITR